MSASWTCRRNVCGYVYVCPGCEYQTELYFRQLYVQQRPHHYQWGGKTISQYGETDFLKFSNGVQYTVSGIPSGETVESVVFYGYPHEAGNQCYIAEFNGVNEDPSAADFSEATADAPKLYNFQEWGITSGSFTFTVKAHETCMKIEITTTSQKLVKFEKNAYSFDLTDPTANDHMPRPENTTGSDITYKSSNTAVAACLNDSTPRLKSTGTTTITATAGGVSDSYTLTVTAPKAAWTDLYLRWRCRIGRCRGTTRPRRRCHEP